MDGRKRRETPLPPSPEGKSDGSQDGERRGWREREKVTESLSFRSVLNKRALEDGDHSKYNAPPRVRVSSI